MEPSTFVSVIFFSAALLCPIALAAPQYGGYYNQGGKAAYESGEKNARILSQSYDLNPADNSFQYSFETENGLSAQAHGYLKGEGQVIEGSFVQPDAEGKLSRVSYIADENGYQPEGDSIHPAIVKAVAYLRTLPPTSEHGAYSGAYSAGAYSARPYSAGPNVAQYYKQKRYD